MLKPMCKTLLLSPLLLVLAGCPSKPESIPTPSGSAAASASVPPSATTAATRPGAASASAQARLTQEMMQAVFGKQFRPASNDAVADLPDIKQRTRRSPHLISGVALQKLEDGTMALITNAQLLDPAGNPMDSHASSGLLGVYLLKNTGSDWQVQKKHENVAELGSHGSFGEVDFVTLAPGRPGIVVHSGGTWQGYTVEDISLFDLTADSLRDLSGESILFHSDSEGGCGPETEECWNISGKYSFVPAKPGVPYQDLLIDFTGEKSVLANQGSAAAAASQAASADDSERKSSKINSRARYAWDGKQYRLVEGENPVPRP